MAIKIMFVSFIRDATEITTTNQTHTLLRNRTKSIQKRSRLQESSPLAVAKLPLINLKEEEKLFSSYPYLGYLFVLQFPYRLKLAVLVLHRWLLHWLCPIRLLWTNERVSGGAHFPTHPSLSTDSSLVKRDKTSTGWKMLFSLLSSSFIFNTQPPKMLQQHAANGPVHVLFFIRCVMVAIKIKQLIRIFDIMFYYCSFFLSIRHIDPSAWPGQLLTSLCPSFSAHSCPIFNRKNRSEFSFTLILCALLRLRMYISTAVNSFVDDDNGCKVHFTRLV